MAVQENLRFDTVSGETLREIEIEGERFYYAYAPARSAYTGLLVLLHGVASNGSRWEEFVEMSPLRENWAVLRVDLRGHGGNESTTRATLERMADDVMALIKDTESVVKQPILLVGHSLGAQIAIHVAIRYSETIDGLVLLDPLVTSALTPVAKEKSVWVPFFRLTEAVFRPLNKLGIARRLPKYSLRQDDERAREMLQKGGEAFNEFIRDFSSPWNDIAHVHLAVYARDLLEVSRPTPDLTVFKAPVLVLASSAGLFTDSKRMKDWTVKLFDGEMATINCAHWPLTECPLDVSRNIGEWIERKFPVRGR